MLRFSTSRLALVLLATTSLRAEVVYRYSGSPLVSQTTKHSVYVVVMATLATPLDSNLKDVNVTSMLLNWSVSAGGFQAAKSSCDGMADFSVSTDAKGAIVGWNVVAGPQNKLESIVTCSSNSFNCPAQPGDWIGTASGVPVESREPGAWTGPLPLEAIGAESAVVRESDSPSKSQHPLFCPLRPSRTSPTASH